MAPLIPNLSAILSCRQLHSSATLSTVCVSLDAATLTEVFPCFFLSCKANARVNLAKTGHGTHSPKLLCRSVYCLCVNVYRTAATG